MTNGRIHVGDVGTLLRCAFVKHDGQPFDISAATTKEISFQRFDGTSFTRAGAFETNGVDGMLIYTTVAGDIDVAGLWYLQGHVAFASGDQFRSDRVRIPILLNNS